MTNAMVEHRAAARETYDTLSEVLSDRGHEAYLDAVEQTLGTPRVSPQYAARLFGGLAVELDARVADLTPTLHALTPVGLEYPIFPTEIRNFYDDVYGITGDLALSDAFCARIPMTSRLQKLLRISDEELEGEKSGDEAVNLLRYATTRGRSTMAFRSIAALAIITNTLEEERVTSQPDLIRLTQANGTRLLTWWSLSQKNFDSAPPGLRVEPQTDPEKDDDKDAIENLYTMYRPDMWPPRSRLKVKRSEGKNGQTNIHIAPKAPNRTAIGCPITLMSQKVIEETWKATLSLAEQAGYYRSGIHYFRHIDDRKEAAARWSDWGEHWRKILREKERRREVA